MKSVLAQENITDKEVKEFLEETASEIEVKRNSFPKDISNPTLAKAIEDIDSLFIFCRAVSDKLGNGKELTIEEIVTLKKLLLSVKLNIERGIVEGSTTGIDNYVRRLEG